MKKVNGCLLIVVIHIMVCKSLPHKRSDNLVENYLLDNEEWEKILACDHECQQIEAIQQKLFETWKGARTFEKRDDQDGDDGIYDEDLNVRSPAIKCDDECQRMARLQEKLYQSLFHSNYKIDNI